MPKSDPPIILIVEDEDDVAETYERWLTDYDVRRAATGEEGLEKLDDSVSVVLLDRMMPGMSGAEVLQEIRNRGVDCQVAMVTAVDPGFDVIEMGFDEYVTKPPSRDKLIGTVERLLDRADLDGDLQEYYSLKARRAALEIEFTDATLEANEEYQQLVDRIEEHRAAVDESLGDMGSDSDFVGAVREIMGEDETSPESTDDLHEDFD